MSKITSNKQDAQTLELCSCRPLFSVQKEHDPGEATGEEQGSFILVAPELRMALRAALLDQFPYATPFSLLLLHITQFERDQESPGSPLAHKRLRCHAPASLLAQVIDTVRRTLRVNDQILVDEKGSGAIFLFPHVDQEGMARLIGRVSYNIDLLQAETVIPPLHTETEIVLGSGSYPTPASSMDKLFALASQVQEQIVFRPAILSQPERTRPRTLTPTHTARYARSKHIRAHEINATLFPFMQIPSRLPGRLKQLIPYELALDLRCAPVGRNHNRLTVAMADPADARAISHLHAATGMAIFPVACEISALETLLASGW